MSLSIPCPACGAVLKLRDTSLLGRTGKCPKCAHRFPLRDPDEVEMQLVETPPPPPPAADAPKVGVGAVWVPDDAPPSLVASTGPSAPVSPTAGTATPAQPASFPDFTAAGEPSPLIIGAAESDPLQRLKRKRKKRNPVQTVVVIASLLLLGAGGYWVWTQQNASGKAAPQPQQAATPKPDASAENEDEIATASGDLGRPTKGQPIELKMIPSGARIIVNLHPAAIWDAGGLGKGEFIAGLGPVGKWLENWLKTNLMVTEPAQIERVLICLIPGARGTPPDVAAVVTRAATHKFKKSDMIDQFGGQSTEVGAIRYYVNEERAMLLQPDMQTYALCPATYAGEMVDALQRSLPTDSGIEELLKRTDQDLHFTVVCVPADLRIHGEFLAPPEAQSFLQSVADWIANDDEAEAVAWSFHLTDDKFFTQFLARNAAVVRPPQLAKSFRTRLEATPQQILQTIKLMNPRQVGKRQLIGRVPAMSKVVQLGTKVETENRLVAMTYTGPERAGPNLALGVLLAWDESTRLQASSGSSSEPGSPGSRKPLKELLQTKIDVDFRRMPLEEAFNYIAGEANFDIFVDGDALEALSYTRNMPQTFQAEGITASAALRMITEQTKQDQICYILDESKNLVTVSTLPFAKDKNLKIYQMK